MLYYGKVYYLIDLTLYLTISVSYPQIIAECLSEEEIAGLKEMFKMIDVDNSGQITLEELKNGLERVGSNLKDSEIIDLMQAVSVQWLTSEGPFSLII